MLILNVEEQELYDPSSDIEFITSKAMTVQLEHSLISMSKWESIWCKPFLPVKGLVDGISNYVEELSYIECMTIGRVPSYTSQLIYKYHGNQVRDYIQHPATATTIYRHESGPRRLKIVTTELIYYWMIRFNIPMECEKWHINRLLTLIDICNIKEKQAAGQGNMTPQQAATHMNKLNAMRLGK